MHLFVHRDGSCHRCIKTFEEVSVDDPQADGRSETKAGGTQPDAGCVQLGKKGAVGQAIGIAGPLHEEGWLPLSPAPANGSSDTLLGCPPPEASPVSANGSRDPGGRAKATGWRNAGPAGEGRWPDGLRVGSERAMLALTAPFCA